MPGIGIGSQTTFRSIETGILRQTALTDPPADQTNLDDVLFYPKRVDADNVSMFMKIQKVGVLTEEEIATV